MSDMPELWYSPSRRALYVNAGGGEYDKLVEYRPTVADLPDDADRLGVVCEKDTQLQRARDDGWTSAMAHLTENSLNPMAQRIQRLEQERDRLRAELAEARQTVTVNPDNRKIDAAVERWTKARDEVAAHKLRPAIDAMVDALGLTAAEVLQQSDDAWQVCVRIPAALPDEMKSSLFKAVADAVHSWEPDDREVWDADVTASPAAVPVSHHPTPNSKLLQVSPTLGVGVPASHHNTPETGCGQCYECVAPNWGPFDGYMIVCPECGNKRCPKATFHDRECTGSNDLGQPGSSYCPDYVAPWDKASGDTEKTGEEERE